MTNEIFQKMRAKPGMGGRVLHAPDGYRKWEEMDWTDAGAAAFVHLFVESRAQFPGRFQEAVAAVEPGCLFWLSYPKSTGKQTYDIYRDSLWDLVIPRGWHPVSQVSLDEKWSAIRLRPNEPGREYVRPGTKTPR